MPSATDGMHALAYDAVAPEADGARGEMLTSTVAMVVAEVGDKRFTGI